jgi:homoserine kinase
MNKIYIKIPASIGNMGSGFDTAGLSLKIYNEFIVEKSSRELFEFSGLPGYSLRTKTKILFTRAFDKGIKFSGSKKFPIAVTVKNRLPVSRGFGSSGTVILAGLIAGLKFAGTKLNKKEILKLALPIEGHIDNLAACLYGGFVIGCRENADVFRMPVDSGSNLKIVAFIPHKRLSTAYARKILPLRVSREDAVYNISRFGFLTAAFFTGNWKLLEKGLQDALHQPYRKKILPHMELLEDRNIMDKCFGGCLSGAGSSVVFFTDQQREKTVMDKIAGQAHKNNFRGTVKSFSPGGRATWKITG